MNRSHDPLKGAPALLGDELLGILAARDPL